MAWSDKYIGIPWHAGGRHELMGGGLDCWGLLRMVYAKELDIPLESFTGANSFNGQQVAAMMAGNMLDWVRVNKPRPFDGVLLRKSGWACHVGVMVDGTRFLHVDQDVDACLERIGGPLWQERVAGFYRHVTLT